MESNYTVYKHTTPNGKVYVGITCRIPQKRWKGGSGYRENEHFYRAVQKYGWENITHEILFEGLTKEDAFEKEIELIAKYQSNNSEYGYNKSLGGDAGFTGLHHTESTKLKIGKASKNRRPTEDARRKMSESRKGRHTSEETRKKMSESNKGKHHTEETKRKISESKKGKVFSEETKRKIGEASRGRISAKRKKVLCLETGIVFESVTSAAEQLHISISGISRVCNGVQKSTGGYSFEWV